MKPTSRQIDALRELINIGVGRGASVLNTMIRSHILLQVPFVKIISFDKLKQEMETLGGGRLASVRLKFKGNFSGAAELIFPAESASKLVTVLTGEDPGTQDLDSVRSATLCEIGNIVLNGVMGSISNILQLRLNYTVPHYTETGIDDPSPFGDSAGSDGAILLARTRFAARELDIEGDVVLLFEVGAFGALLESIDTYIGTSGNQP